MKVHTTPDFQLIFCDARDNLFPAGYLATSFYPLDLTRSPYAVLAQKLSSEQGSVLQESAQQITQQLSIPKISEQQTLLKSIVILKQTHSTQGFCVTTENLVSLTTAPRHEGDFLCTQLSGVGIGVLTADCLPMAFYDPINHAAAIVHAGWRGMVDGIGAQTVQCMRDSFGTRPEDLQVFIGPCAKTCCYQVSEDFIQNLTSFSWADNVIERRENGLFFNLPLCNSLLLQDAGVRSESISYEYNSCTICNSSFCSYRRDAGDSCRQLALIVLTEADSLCHKHLYDTITASE
jgi:YfiH family protein